MLWINSVFSTCSPHSSRRPATTSASIPPPPTHKTKPQTAAPLPARLRPFRPKDFFLPTNASPAPQACSKDMTPSPAASTKKTENNRPLFSVPLWAARIFCSQNGFSLPRALLFSRAIKKDVSPFLSERSDMPFDNFPFRSKSLPPFFFRGFQHACRNPLYAVTCCIPKQNNV